MRLTGAVREAEVLSKNAIRYSQAGNRYSVLVLFAKHPITASVCQVKGFIQVDGSLACARVVEIVSITVSTIARFRIEEECITASGIENHFMALINHSGSCRHCEDSRVKFSGGSPTCMTPDHALLEPLTSTRGSDALFKELLELRLRPVPFANGIGRPVFLSTFDCPWMSFLIQHENPDPQSQYQSFCLHATLLDAGLERLQVD